MKKFRFLAKNREYEGFRDIRLVIGVDTSTLPHAAHLPTCALSKRQKINGKKERS
jgi:hypothetical protein